MTMHVGITTCVANGGEVTGKAIRRVLAVGAVACAAATPAAIGTFASAQPAHPAPQPVTIIPGLGTIIPGLGTIIPSGHQITPTRPR
jgi:hypothetical protein